MKKETKNKIGAQQGNLNALKHGFYSKVLKETAGYDFDSAIDVTGIDEEIALLRLEIRKAVSGEDERNLLLLVKAAGALERLVRTRYRISNAQRHTFREGVSNVIQGILVPLGTNVVNAIINKNING